MTASNYRLIEKWEAMLRQVEANDNILLDTTTITTILKTAEWFDAGSAEWELAARGLAGDSGAAIQLVDLHYAGCNVYTERVWRRQAERPEQAWGAIINPPEGMHLGQKAFASSQARAMILSLLKLDITIVRKLYGKDGNG